MRDCSSRTSPPYRGDSGRGDVSYPQVATPSRPDTNATLEGVEPCGLRMSYDGFEAVRGIDLRVVAGRDLHLPWSQRRRKTTTVEILEGHRKRTAGDVQVLGEDPEPADRWWRSRVGVVLQTSRVEPRSPCGSVWSSMPGTTRAAVCAGGDRARRPEEALGGELRAVVRWPAAASRRRTGVDRRPGAGVPR